MRLRTLYILNLLFLFTFLLTGCSQKNNHPIVTINYTPPSTQDNLQPQRSDELSNKSTCHELDMEDFLYRIWMVEKDGNQLEEYSRKKLDCSYWDYEYNGSTIRELAKDSIIAAVVMDEILFDQAKQYGLELTKEEIKANQDKLNAIYTENPEKELFRVGLTREIITNALDKISLADKYKKKLCKDLVVDEDAIRESIHRVDYSSDTQYEHAVANAIAAETDLQFKPIYDKLKSDYDITINFDSWDKIIIGSITQ